jgi:chemotaxis protein methyltransferase CheR
VSAAPVQPLPVVPLEGDDEALELLKRKIESERGFNCQFYKDKCLRRRLAVRMRARGVPSYGEYAALLDSDEGEYDFLLDTLTINVTKFFRNRETWEKVEELVLPDLFRRSDRQLRVWSAGAASGEEAYTVSILLHEYAERTQQQDRLGRFHIVGSDIDRRSLEAARMAEYPELSLTETPEAVREAWFSPGPPFRLRADARRNVSFVRRDLISGAAEAEQHLILCRNVVIYFDREIQERLFQSFYDALVPGGFLVLGKVETLLGSSRSLFRAVNNRERIFQRPE